MKLTLCNEVIRDLALVDQARFASALGYQGLEVAPFTLDATAPHALDDRFIDQVRRTVEGEGMVVSGLHWLLVAPAGLSITAPDPAVRKRTHDVIAGLIRLCAQLGGSYLIHGSPQQRMLPAQGTDRARSLAEETFAYAAEQAEQYGVDYLLEPLSTDQTPFVNTLEQALQIVEQIDSPSFGTMLDCCSAARSEAVPIEQLLTTHMAGGRLRHVHVNDPELTGPGQGRLNFAPIVDALIGLEYDRWIGVEPFSYVPDGPAAAAYSIGTMRALIRAADEKRAA